MSQSEKNKVLNEKLEWLESLEDKYQISTDLAMRVKKTLKFYHSKNSYDTLQLLDVLPRHLYFELALSIYHDIIKSFRFFKNKPNEFTAFMVPYFIKTRLFKGDLLCKEGSESTEMYFLYKGILGAVDNFSQEEEDFLPYYILEKGKIYCEFGETQEVLQSHMNTIVAMKDSELLVLKLGVCDNVGF